jgi:hypothetical protein
MLDITRRPYTERLQKFTSNAIASGIALALIIITMGTIFMCSYFALYWLKQLMK